MSFSNPISGSHELRRYPRKNILEWPLLSFEMLVADDAGPVQRHSGIVLNLSEGGVAVQPFRRLAPGDAGWLQLGFSSASRSMMREGKVAWVGPNGRVGIRFVEPPGEEQDVLRRWLNHKPLRQQHVASPLPETIPDGVSEFEAALRLIAERARFVTRASGAAIAVGDSAGMECRATSGSAPDVGTILQPGAGLSGYCLSQGKIVNCADVRTDARVDAVVARQLEMRSVLIIPSFVSGEIAGLLEVFSPQPHAFDKRQVSRLKVLGEMIGAAIEEDRAKASGVAQADRLSAFEALPVPLAEIPPTPVAQDSSAEWLPRLRSVLSGFDKEVPEEPSSTAAVPTDEFALMSYVDSPSFRFPLVAVKTGIGFVLLAVLGAFAWHAIQLRGHRPVAAAATVSDSEGASSPQQIVLKLAPPNTAKKVGATFTVDVTLDGAKNLSSVPLEIQYDPKLLQFVSVSNGDLLSKDGQSVALVHREQRGAIQLTATRPPSAAGASGSGTVFTLVFLAKAPGKANFAIKPAILRDSKMNPISVDSAETTVTIRS